MKNHFSFLCSLFALIITTFSHAFAAPSSSAKQIPPKLRGYGRVNAAFRDVRDRKTGLTYTLARYDADSRADAVTVAAKCLADITLSPGTHTRIVSVHGRRFRFVEVAAGPSYVAAVSGHTALVASAANTQALERVLASDAAFSAPGVDTQPQAYPAYLDRFDRYGWGFYGMGGVQGEFGWMGSPLAGPQADPLDDIKYCVKNGFRYDLWMDTGSVGDAQGMRYWPELRWKMDEANKRGLPVSGRVGGYVPYTPAYAAGFQQQARFLLGGWYWNTLDYKADPHWSWNSAEAADYMARQTQQQIRQVKDNPLFLSWMNPLGEIGWDPWYDMNRDFSPPALTSWRTELRDRQHLTLAGASRLYARNNGPFTSWDQVTPPTYVDFAGWPQRVLDLAGTWQCQLETTPGQGVAASWWQDPHTDPGWVSLQMPGSDLWRQFEVGQNDSQDKWCSREFTVTPQMLARRAPLYLYLFLRPNKGYSKLPVNPVYLNGQHAGDFGVWGAIDVTKFLRPGQNRIDFETDGWNGPVYLSTETPKVYPYLGAERDRLYVLWVNWMLNARRDFIATNMDAIRAVDPNRPIKMMAPGYSADRWLPVAARYGGWGHFTGEGIWFYPWFKRYGYLYDVPGTSEGAGPTDTVPGMVAEFQRVFLEGLNGHEDVFIAQHYTRNAALRPWYDRHIAILKQMGRYDIAGPQVLIYRPDNSSFYTPLGSAYPRIGGANAREVQSIWNWDIGRGTLQTLGQSYLYVSDNGVRDGKLNGYKILMDCGSQSVDPRALDGIGKWVRAGGTFITWPFTGESTYDKPDTWPISRLTGCTVTRLRTPGRGRVTFARGETLLPGWGGRTFADDGHCLDWQGHENNQISAELAPGKDCVVVARFEDGAPAIVVHRLGKGRVVALGSAFFRNVQDKMGIWWPKPLEAKFFGALLNSLGQPSVNTTTDPLVWPQRYRMNNGLDDVVVVNNFAGANRRFRLSATLGAVPARVYRVSENSVAPVPFQAAGNRVFVTASIPKDEVQAYLFRAHTAGDAGRHWWAYQQRMWKPVVRGGGYTLPAGAKPWHDPVINLADKWQWTQAPPDDWATSSTGDRGWKTYSLDILNFAGADASRPIYLHRHFAVPPAWLQSGSARLEQGPFEGGYYLPGEQGQLFLNGTPLHDWGRPDYFVREVQPLLRAGDNLLAFALKPGTGKYLGVVGTTFLVHARPPLKTIDLAGTYSATLDGKPTTVVFPGTATVGFPNRAVFIPADWKGKYEVVFYARSDTERPKGVWVNDNLYTRRTTQTGELEIDITPLLRFGRENTLSPTNSVWNNVKPDKYDIAAIALRLYPKSR